MEGIVETMGGWSTVYEIAGRRNDTKQGHKPLSDHAYKILEAMVETEIRRLMEAAMQIGPQRRF